MATIIDGDFEWDEDKAASNFSKHRISFAEAATVFADPAAVYLDDGSGRVGWWSSAPRCGTVFSTLCMSSADGAIESSALDQRVAPNETCTNQKASHDSSS